MTEPHFYQIEIRHGELLIELSSDDVYFISKQMDKWLRQLLDESYVPLPLLQTTQPVPPAPVLQPAVPSAAAPEPVATPPVLEAPTASETLAQPAVASVAPLPQPEPAPVIPPVAVAESLPSQPVAAVVSEPPIPMQTVTELPTAQMEIPLAEADAVPPAPQPEPQFITQPQIRAQQAAPAPAMATAETTAPDSLDNRSRVQTLDDKVQDDFEAVMDTLMRDLEQSAPQPSGIAAASASTVPAATSYELPPSVGLPTFAPAASTAAVLGAFTATAGKGLSSAKVNLSAIETLAELCEQSNVTTSEDHLILTAYFLTHFEGVDKFSLKRINSLLVKSGRTPVNHSVLEASMGKDFLVMVPDLTGMADVSEYTLTELGQQQANKLLS